MDKDLKNAVNRQINKNKVSGPRNGRDGGDYYSLDVIGTHNHDDYIEMLNHLPNLMNDTEKITTILGGLLGIIAQQQQEILELKNLVKCAVLDKTKVEIEEKFKEHVENIIKEHNIEGVEFDSSVELTAENQNIEEYKFDEKSEEFNSQSSKIGGGLKGLLSILASLEIGKEEENTNLKDIVTKIDEKVSNSQKLHYIGKITSKYGKITSKGWFK